MSMRSMMLEMLDQLDRRERFILRGRFALGAHRKVRTFQCLADKLGVSKERVRQLEQRAIIKLKALVETVQRAPQPSLGAVI
jgi:RNA polymerase primary sigma factor